MQSECDSEKYEAMDGVAKPNQKHYERPQILAREALEVMATTCQGPGKASDCSVINPS